MKTLFLTGNESCHNFLIYQIISGLNVKEFAIVKYFSGLSDMEFFSEIYKKEEMSQEEEEYLKKYILSRNRGLKEFESIPYENEFICSSSQEFNAKVASLLETESFEYIFSYGAPIIKSQLAFSDAVKSVNLHFGLSRFYRGAETNIYALSRKEFEKVGLTAHKLEKKVDSGRILFEIMPDKRDFMRINSINELNELLLRKTVDKLVEILRAGEITYTRDGYEQSELILDAMTSIDHVIRAENNLKDYKTS